MFAEPIYAEQASDCFGRMKFVGHSAGGVNIYSVAAPSEFDVMQMGGKAKSVL